MPPARETLLKLATSRLEFGGYAEGHRAAVDRWTNRVKPMWTTFRSARPSEREAIIRRGEEGRPPRPGGHTPQHLASPLTCSSGRRPSLPRSSVCNQWLCRHLCRQRAPSSLSVILRADYDSLRHGCIRAGSVGMGRIPVSIPNLLERVRHQPLGRSNFVSDTSRAHRARNISGRANTSGRWSSTGRWS